MRLGIDEHVHLDSPLHRWDPRYKLIGLVSLMFSFSFIHDPRMMAAMVGTTIAIYVVSRLPSSFIVRRLRLPSLFLLAVVISLPFLSGETVIATLGPAAVYKEGLLMAGLIAVRFVCILTIGMVLFSTTPLLTNINALRALGLPSIIADIALLALRYLQEIGQDLTRMQTSMRLRGLRERRLSPRGLRVLAWLSGSLLVRSYERSEWIYKAMLTRGYGNAPIPRKNFSAGNRDGMILGLTIATAAVFVALDVTLGHNTVTLLQ